MSFLHYSIADFDEMEKHFRTKFVNSLSGFKSVNLVGSKGFDGVENLAIFSQVFHIGSNPAALGMILRPATVPRNTLTNIEQSKHFTINHIHPEIVQMAHQTSARYDKLVSEFKEVGLTSWYSEACTAPYVEESRIKIGLRLVERYNVKYNDTILLIGEILECFVPENILREDGFLDIHEAETVTVASIDAYHKTEKIERLSYAKANKLLTVLDKKLF